MEIKKFPSGIDTLTPFTYKNNLYEK
ncbi:hypothetical protein PSEUDO8Z_160390 [Pseudomonas sp. 8Z]|nr:hypothetical protein PSEUDO8Z_160390 [Pseudomonas sp. 8Z]